MKLDEASDPRVGTVVQERYRILERLSSGGMGVVYRAERLQLGRAVAIKFLHPHFASYPDFTKLFEREALTMSRLNHPHCVSVIDFGTADAPYIVMDFVTGTTLGDLIDEGPVPPARALGILRQMLAGLAHAHEQGIIHRDIKPANVMLTKATGTGDHVHILDFGLAKLRDPGQSAGHSMTGIVVGTPSYMSPEQASCEKLDARSDVYSAGVVLFELLTGEKPFRAAETHELLRMHREAPPPALRAVYPEGRLSDELEAVIQRALAKKPDDRYQSTLELADALAAVQPSAQLAAGKPPPAIAAATPPAIARAAPEPMEPLARAAADAVPRRPRGGRGLVWVALLAAAGGWALLGAPGLPSAWRGAVESGAERARSALDDRGTASPASPAVEVRSVQDVEALLAAGDQDGALRGLHELRRGAPQDAKVLVLLGDVYFEKDWWAEGLAAYRNAVIADPELRARPAIVNNAIAALGRAETEGKARVLLVQQLDRAALPALRRAARGASDPAASARIRAVIEQIEALEPQRPPARGATRR